MPPPIYWQCFTAALCTTADISVVPYRRCHRRYIGNVLLPPSLIQPVYRRCFRQFYKHCLVKYCRYMGNVELQPGSTLPIYRQCRSRLDKRSGCVCGIAVPPALNRRCICQEKSGKRALPDRHFIANKLAVQRRSRAIPFFKNLFHLKSHKTTLHRRCTADAAPILFNNYIAWRKSPKLVPGSVICRI
jgi:hypothetical protein